MDNITCYSKTVIRKSVFIITFFLFLNLVVNAYGADHSTEVSGLLKDINHNICTNFDSDLNKMAAILDQEKTRQHITQTRVAYGMGDTPMDSAGYYLNYAAEAVAYQKVQDYTPKSLTSESAQESLDNLISSLTTLSGKVLRAKTEIRKALDYYEK